jgi:flagella basal body P-ring formation protein FlgA
VQADPDALLGRTLAQPLPAGQPVRSSSLRPRQWFAAGDTVRIVARGNGFAVSGEGQALSHGIEGQRARVRTEGGRIVSGEPRGDRRLELLL